MGFEAQTNFLREMSPESFECCVAIVPQWNSRGGHLGFVNEVSALIRESRRAISNDGILWLVSTDVMFGESAYKVDHVSIARKRSEIHNKHSSQRKLSKDYDLVGLSGERQFSMEFGGELDVTIKAEGDSGIDFTSDGVGTVDVKTYRKAYNLLREERKEHATVLVLAQYNEANHGAELLGWEYSESLLDCPKKDFGYGVVNHYKHASKLKPIAELKKMCNIDLNPLEMAGIPWKIAVEVQRGGWILRGQYSPRNRMHCFLFSKSNVFDHRKARHLDKAITDHDEILHMFQRIYCPDGGECLDPFRIVSGKEKVSTTGVLSEQTIGTLFDLGEPKPARPRWSGG